MYLEFNQVIIDNFKTFRKKVTFPLTHPNPGLRFVRGRNDAEPDLGANGAAKSSLFTAICWCLYGQTIDGLKTPDVVPWETDLVPVVAVVAYADNKKKTITRRGNKLTINGLEASQADIDALLPLEIFRHTVLLGQGEALFFDLGPREKMDVLATALILDRWEGRSEKAKAKVKELATEVDNIGREVQNCQTELDVGTDILAKLDKQATTWAADRAARRDERREQINKLRADLAVQQKIEATAELALDSAETELKALDTRRSAVSTLLTEAEVDLGKARLLQEGLEDVQKALKKELAGITGKGDVCPTCGQSLKGTALATHKKQLETRIQALQNDIKMGLPKKVTHRAATLTSELAEIDRYRVSFQDKAFKARSTLKMVTTARLQAEINTLEAQQAEVDDEVNPHRAQATDLRRQLKELNRELEELATDHNEAAQELARTQVWVPGFKEVRLGLIEDFLQEYELATNAMLPESGLQGWSVHYDIERETKKGTVVAGLNVTVLSPYNTKPVKWKVWSGGEKLRLRTVGSLALAEVLLSHAGVQTNLEVLDEPTYALSTEGVQDLFAYLAQRAKQLDKDIFTIDHQAVESRYFAEVITVVKNADGSFIED